MINIDDCEENISDSSMSQTDNTIILHLYFSINNLRHSKIT